MLFPPSPTPSLLNNATTVVLMREGTQTVLSMQNDYQGPPENFAMVVPVPVVLNKENVKTLSADIFSRVDRLAAPRLVEYWEQDPCNSPIIDVGRSRMASVVESVSEASVEEVAEKHSVTIQAARKTSSCTFWRELGTSWLLIQKFHHASSVL